MVELELQASVVIPVPPGTPAGATLVAKAPDGRGIPAIVPDPVPEELRVVIPPRDDAVFSAHDAFEAWADIPEDQPAYPTCVGALGVSRADVGDHPNAAAGCDAGCAALAAPPFLLCGAVAWLFACSASKSSDPAEITLGDVWRLYVKYLLALPFCGHAAPAVDEGAATEVQMSGIPVV